MSMDGRTLEHLEARRLLSAVLDGEVLWIEGTADADAIVIEAGEAAGELLLFGVPGVADGTAFGAVKRVVATLGRGDDELRVRGAVRSADDGPLRVRVAGNAGDDLVVGGAGRGNLHGGPGADILRGGFRRDRLFGGGRGDRLAGGGAADLLDGGAGADVLRGRRGADELLGGPGLDRLIGGGGGDELLGGEGADTILGGFGADLIHGEGGDDLLLGGAGPDRLFGDGEADRLFGGMGADWLYGGLGEDSIVGGLGSDTLLGDAGEVEDWTGQDAQWIDDDGDETPYSAFTEQFWEALDVSVEALQRDDVAELEAELDLLEVAIEENAEAYFDVLGQALEDANVEEAAMDAFGDLMHDLGEDIDDYFDELVDDLWDDVGDEWDDFIDDLF